MDTSAAFFQMPQGGIMEVSMITSQTNPRVKNLAALMQKAKVRKQEDAFGAEGIKMFLEAPEKKLQEVFLSRSFYEKINQETDKEVIQKLECCGYEVLSDSVFAKIADTQTPQGILSVIRQQHYDMEDMLKEESPLLLLLEDIQDPGNLGTIIRTAEGAGVQGIIMSRGTVDIYNPKTIRSTMGSIYRMPFLYTGDLGQVIKQLEARKIRVYAAHLQGKENYDRMDYRFGTAFLIGNEGNGLREETARAAHCYMKIPMRGQVESLNAGVAAAILMYEAARQRA